MCLHQTETRCRARQPEPGSPQSPPQRAPDALPQTGAWPNASPPAALPLALPLALPKPSKGAAPASAQGAPQPAATAAAVEDARQPAPNARRKLWQLPSKYLCPVIGTCLHVQELRGIARKADCMPWNAVTDYQVHAGCVTAAEDRNPLSAAMQKTLERKYASIVRRFGRAKSRGALRELWQQACNEGQVPAAFWALMTHPRADAALQQAAYEDVHMLSHQIGAGLSADIEALGTLRRDLAALRKQRDADAARHASTTAAKDKALIALKARLAALEADQHALIEARARIHDLESGNALRALWERIGALETERESARCRCQAAEAALADIQAQLQARQAQAEHLEAALAEREASCRVLEQALGSDATDSPTAHAPVGALAGNANDCPAGGNCDGCPDADRCAVDLGGRRILCVGGRGSLAARYRTLVARCNGELIRHDGGLEQSRQRLEALLASADAVVCPADCVSHDAYLRTKRYCKRTAKPCMLLERSGIGAFAQALAALAAQADGDAPGRTEGATSPS